MDQITSTLSQQLRKCFKMQLLDYFQNPKNPKTIIKLIMKKIMKQGCFLNMNLLIKTKILQFREKFHKQIKEQTQNDMIKLQIYQYLGAIISKEYLRFKRQQQVIEIKSSHSQAQEISCHNIKTCPLTEPDDKANQSLEMPLLKNKIKEQSKNIKINIGKFQTKIIQKYKKPQQKKQKKNTQTFGHLIFGDKIKKILDVIVLPNITQSNYPVLIEWQQRKDQTKPLPSVLLIQDIMYYLPQYAEKMQFNRNLKNKVGLLEKAETDQQKQKKKKHKRKTIYK